jgi:hypothetical protein
MKAARHDHRGESVEVGAHVGRENPPTRANIVWMDIAFQPMDVHLATMDTHIVTMDLAFQPMDL